MCKTFHEVMIAVGVNTHKLLNNIMLPFFIQNFYYVFILCGIVGPGFAD